MGVDGVDIVIPVYGAAEELCRCVQNLYRNTPGQFQLYLVDDANTDPRVREVLEEAIGCQANCTLLRLPRRSGFPMACNVGWRRGRAPLVCFLNSDVVPAPRWLELLTAIFSDKGVGAAGPSTSRAAGAQQLGRYAAPRAHMTDSEVDAAGEWVYRNKRGVERCELSGFCLLTRRVLLECVGGFDVSYGMGYGEENQYQWELRRRGYRCVWVRQAYVHHLGGRSFRLLPRDQVAAMRLRNRWRIAAVRGARWARRR